MDRVPSLKMTAEQEKPSDNLSPSTAATNLNSSGVVSSVDSSPAKANTTSTSMALSPLPELTVDTAVNSPHNNSSTQLSGPPTFIFNLGNVTDVNRDGNISPSKNASKFAAVPAKNRANYYKVMKQVFDAFDADKSGTIDSSEFVDFWAKAGKAISLAEADRLISHFDSDQSGQISFDEFVVLMETIMPFQELYDSALAQGAEMNGDKFQDLLLHGFCPRSKSLSFPRHFARLFDEKSARLLRGLDLFW